MRYAQLVMGPAGSGKSTYCNVIQKHCELIKRTAHVINLDPAAEHFNYNLTADIRDLIALDDAMDEETLRFGPNGGLVFCMEYFAQNFDWLEEQLGEDDDDFFIFDCPGQIELYTHIPVMRQLVDQLRMWDFHVCGIFLIESQFMIEVPKFISGVMCALSVMINLEIPHVNVLTKVDLLDKNSKKQLERFLDPEMKTLISEQEENSFLRMKYRRLNEAIADLIDDYSLVRFLPFDITDEENVMEVLMEADKAIQYGEDFEPKEPREKDHDEEDSVNVDN